MKFTVSFLLASIIFIHCHSQSLEGEWRGSFIVTNSGTQVGSNIPGGGYVNLIFTLNKDSSYTVYSIYESSDTLNVCEVKYKRLNKDSICLEETKIIKPSYTQWSKCFQKMYLKIQQKKKVIELVGSFHFVSGGICPSTMMPESSFGDIRFSKKIE